MNNASGSSQRIVLLAMAAGLSRTSNLEMIHERARPRESRARFRMLLLAPEFPPRGSAGALRWQEMSRAFAAEGWEIDVCTSSSDSTDNLDWQRMDRLPAGVRVFAVEVRSAASERLFLRLWRMLGQLSGVFRGGETTGEPEEGHPESPADDEVSWVRGAIRFGLEDRSEREAIRCYVEAAGRIADGNEFDCVLSCGPPHWVHEAGIDVADALACPLITDLRDPWAILEPATAAAVPGLWKRAASRRERRMVDRADLIAMNTDRARRAMVARYPSASDRTIVVRNGVNDESDAFATTAGSKPVPSNDVFRMVYAGSIYLDRDPSGLFRAVAALVEAEGLAPRDLSLVFVGPNDAESLHAAAEGFGLAESLDARGPCPRSELVGIYASASVLVSLPQGHDMAIPSKVYEYMDFDRWLLAIARSESATGELLSETVAVLVDPDDPSGLTRAVADLYQKHRAGTRAPRIADDPSMTRSRQAETLRREIEARLIRS